MAFRYYYTVILGFLFLSASAQDSLVQKKAGNIDSVYQYKNKSLDSIQQNFRHHTDSLQRAYAAPMKQLQAQIGKLNHKKDSLSKLNLSTTSVTHQIDSVQRAQTKKLNDLNAQMSKAKSETLSKVAALHLPPEAQNEVNSLTKNINGFSVPKNFFNLPSMNLKMPSLGPGLSLKLPSNLAISQAKIPALQNFSLGSPPTLPSLSQLEGSLGKEVSQLKSLSRQANAQALEKGAMNVANQNGELKTLNQEKTKLEGMEKEVSQLKNPKRADSLAMQQLQPAVNHFAGKEQELKTAMDKVSKLKQKYSSVKSMADLPKRAPNPLRDKPWIERVVPGINYFVQNKHYALVDLNPYIGWRFTPKLTATIGWNERIGIMHGDLHTNRYDRVYGIRTTASYLWTHGIIFKIAPEVMRAYVPTTGTQDEKHQASVWSFYAGIRKDFPIYKKIKGYSEVLYNFTQKPLQSVYGDPVSFRFGMEIQLKKKGKKK